MDKVRDTLANNAVKLRRLEQRVDAMYAELGDLKRHLILHAGPLHTQDDSVWHDLMDVSNEVTARWDGADAVDEIRAQR